MTVNAGVKTGDVAPLERQLGPAQLVITRLGKKNRERALTPWHPDPYFKGCLLRGVKGQLDPATKRPIIGSTLIEHLRRNQAGNLLGKGADEITLEKRRHLPLAAFQVACGLHLGTIVELKQRRQVSTGLENILRPGAGRKKQQRQAACDRGQFPVHPVSSND